MPNYEQRLLKFLQQNPTIGIDTNMIAGMWKRKIGDVQIAANILLNKRKIKETPTGELSLVTC